VSGNIPPGVTEKYWVPVHGMPHYVAVVLDALLTGGGIVARGNPITGTVPLDARVLWQHRSKPLPALVKHMLVYSDNHFAEQFMRSVGGLDGATPDDRDGVQAERHVLEAQGVPTPGLHLVDGSGLAHANRIAAITLARLLSHLDRNPGSNPVYGLLPRGGLDGTLKMYHFTSAAGRVRAKSGHLDAASSLAGYVDTKMHGRVVFAFMINGSPGDPDAAIVAAVDRLAER
jgi:D-alanyl-D-alanine carboxypeptidase/D-alanyl-D-alanine-endopeptidase (penicillin-binding protein 4)